MRKNSFNCEFIEPIESMGFNHFDLEYWKSPERFSRLTSGIPDLSDISQQIKSRSHYRYRSQISSILRRQYQQFHPESKAIKQIQLLAQDNTFTVICAHQPCLFGGPAFWAYKILSVLKICKQLSLKYPEYNFIPVYFSGNEDHDFEEINHVHIFNHRLEWNEQSGMSVGSLPVNGLYPVINEMNRIFERNESALQFFSNQKQFLDSCQYYADYFRFFVDSLFGEKGLLYFNPNDPEAKELFAPIIKEELLHEFVFTQTRSACGIIEEMNLPLQVNPRDLNLFYHHSTGRRRIQKLDGKYNLVDTNVYWNESQIINLLEKESFNFSPNVLMRPMYQELLFPNIAFVGGGGEIAYWLQLRDCFNHVSLPYPLLFRRLSAFHFDQNLLAKISKTAFSAKDFLRPYHQLEKEFISIHSQSIVSIDDPLNCIQDQLQKINLSSKSLDDPTQKSIEAEIQKILKSLDQITSRRNKVIKQKYDQDLITLQKIKSVLYPENSIQERIQSFLPMYLDQEKEFFNLIEDSYNPGRFELSLFFENA
jgi:bacillithiol synthase